MPMDHPKWRGKIMESLLAGNFNTQPEATGISQFQKWTKMQVGVRLRTAYFINKP